MRRTIRLRESELRHIISESVRKILNETYLNDDEDDFNGRWNGSKDDYINLDDPDNVPDFSDKNMENEYSWNLFDRKPVAPGLDNHYMVGKSEIPREIDYAISDRNAEKGEWRRRQLNRAKRRKNNWLNSKI